MSGGNHERWAAGRGSRLKESIKLHWLGWVTYFRESNWMVCVVFIAGLLICGAVDAFLYPFMPGWADLFREFEKNAYDVYSDLLVISGFSLTFISYILSRSEDKIKGVSFRFRLKLILPDGVLKQLMITYVAGMALGFFILLVGCYITLLYVLVFEGVLCIVIVYSIFAVSDTARVLDRLWDRCIDEKNGLLFRPVEVMILSIDYEDQDEVGRLRDHFIRAVQEKIGRVIRYRSELKDFERDGHDTRPVPDPASVKLNRFTYHLTKRLIEKCGLEEIFDRERIQEILLAAARSLMMSHPGQEAVVAEAVMGTVQAVIQYFPKEETAVFVERLLTRISQKEEAKDMRSFLYSYFLLYGEFLMQDESGKKEACELLLQIWNQCGKKLFSADDLAGDYRTKEERSKCLRDLWKEWCDSGGEMGRRNLIMVAADRVNHFINDLYTNQRGYGYESEVFQYLLIGRKG